MPELTSEWRDILLKTRDQIARGCDKCAKDSLCVAHDPIFRWVYRMALANIPCRYWPLEFENALIKDQRALKFVRDAAENVTEAVQRGLGFSVFGTWGSGKTTLTLYFLKAALRAGFSGYFALMESLMTLIKDTFADNADGVRARERFEVVRSVNVLLLDDLGKEYISKTDFVIARLDELLRWRDAMGFSTNFSCNLGREAFEARYGGGIISLLSNTNKPIALQGDDIRPTLGEWGEVCPT